MAQINGTGKIETIVQYLFNFGEMKKKILLTALFAALCAAAWFYFNQQPEETALDYGEPNAKFRYAERKNLSPYAMFGDSSVTLLTEAERKGISYLKVTNSNAKSDLGSIIFELSTGFVRFYDKTGMLLHSTLLEPEDLAKFLSVDPSAEKFSGYSPYHYAGNNPIRNIDPDGREFTDAAQKWVDRYMNDVGSRYDKNNAKIAKLQGKLDAGGLSEKQMNKLNRQIGNLQGANAELDVIRGEVATLAASSQIYDVQMGSGFSDSGTDRAGAGFDFSTGNFVITMPSTKMGLFSHELKHAYQFETGNYSVGPEISGVAHKNLLYDKHDELEGYARGAIFGGDRYSTTGSLPADYKNVAEGPYNSGNIAEISGALASPDPSKHLQRISNVTGHAFRVNGVTYYKKKP